MPSECLVIEHVLGSDTMVYRLLGFNFICANKKFDLIIKSAASARSYYFQHIPHRFLIKLSVFTAMVLRWPNTETCVHVTRLSQHSVTMVMNGLNIVWHICPMQELLSHRNFERHETTELCLRSRNVHCSLLGNKQCNNEFSAVSAATVAMQWFGKHVSTIQAEFSVRSARRLYNMTW
jgi:hypothetical protein